MQTRSARFERARTIETHIERPLGEARRSESHPDNAFAKALTTHVQVQSPMIEPIDP
jgi:hypothetical protein